MKKILINAGIGLAISLHLACNPCGDEQKDYYYSYNGGAGLMVMEKWGNHAKPLDSTKTITYNNLIIRIEGRSIFVQKLEAIPFFPSAYACSPPDPNYYGLEQISALQISSDIDFNSSHPAGSSLNDLFKINTWENSDTIALPLFCSRFPNMPPRFMSLFLISPPDQPAIKFDIKMSLSNGQVLLKTPTVHIQ